MKLKLSKDTLSFVKTTSPIIVIIIIGFYIYKNYIEYPTTDHIATLTDNWIKEVTINNNPKAVYNLFCSDGNLVGTVSQTIRKGKEIETYFDYFAKLPGIKVFEKKYNISKVTSDVFINTAFITWYWTELDKPITARMTFVFRNNCIYQLHSSQLPEVNEQLRKISNNTQ
jgi:hypothetical protein